MWSSKALLKGKKTVITRSGKIMLAVMLIVASGSAQLVEAEWNGVNLYGNGYWYFPPDFQWTPAVTQQYGVQLPNIQQQLTPPDLQYSQTFDYPEPDTIDTVPQYYIPPRAVVQQAVAEPGCDIAQEFTHITVTVSGNSDVASQLRDKEIICKALREVPTEHTRVLKELTIRYGESASKKERGAAGGRIMFINGSLPELYTVFLHELAHNVDSSVLEGSPLTSMSAYGTDTEPVFADDRSIGFYEISWKDATHRRTGRASDFVSGYAKSDQFEDFAESYNFYITQGELFRTWALTNDALQKKYTWLKDNVFGGREYYQSASGSQFAAAGRPWDSTVMR